MAWLNIELNNVDHFQDSEEAGPLLVIGERRVSSSRTGVSGECRLMTTKCNNFTSVSRQAVQAGAGGADPGQSLQETNKTAGCLPGPGSTYFLPRYLLETKTAVFSPES